MDVHTHPQEGSGTVVDQLLDAHWEGRGRGGDRRELTVEATAALLFVLTVAAMLVCGGGFGGVAPITVALLVAVYALVARVEFPWGASNGLPTQLVLVPMFVLLAPAVVPAAVAAGLVLSTLPDWRRGPRARRRALSGIPDAWHSVGPAALLLAAGSPRLSLAQTPLLVAAFFACCAADLLSSVSRMWLAGIVSDWTVQLRVIAAIWVLDACLAPLGFLIGVAARARPVIVLVVGPLVLLLWLLARDRSKRIDQAHDRLKLVEHERARLRNAVERLGDAFAAKLEVSALMETLLRGSLEAVDGEAGWLGLTGLADWQDLSVGDPGLLGGFAPARAADADGGVVGEAGPDLWTLSVPIVIGGSSAASGAIRFTRRGRPFVAADRDTVAELVLKAQLAAEEILGHHRLREQAFTDPLTGLGNRRRLMGDLDAACARGREGRRTTLLLFDLDGFKKYNDTLGHLAGDALLTRLGGRLSDAVACAGAAYRLGGDEFCARIDLAEEVPEALIERAAAALCESDPQCPSRGSLGLVLIPDEAASSEAAIQLADERMYAHKQRRPRSSRGANDSALLEVLRLLEPRFDAEVATVADLVSRTCRRLEVASPERESILQAAKLSCVGKVGVPDQVLNKPGPLTHVEWQLVRQHALVGERMLSTVASLAPAAGLVRALHERWDGRGVPDGLAGNAIPLGARIITVCGAYGAMISERPYRPALSPERARRELRAGAGAQFDPVVVAACLDELDATAEREHDAVRDAAAHVRALIGAAG